MEDAVILVKNLKTLALVLALNFCLAPAWAAEKAGTEFAGDRTESAVAKAVSRVLERGHYSQLTFDDELSYKFLARYLDTLDPMRMHFLQSDVNEFMVYSNRLDDLTEKQGDTTPAHLIFA